MAGNDIHMDQKEFAKAIASFDEMSNAIDERYLKNTQARIARREIVPAMKARSKSHRLSKMISVTTAKRYTPKNGIRAGVVKNDKSLFPDFTAQALASVIEYGTAERYRQLKTLGFVSGRQSTGSMPAAPFLRPGWDASVNSFMDNVQDVILKRIEKAAE